MAPDAFVRAPADEGVRAYVIGEATGPVTFVTQGGARWLAVEAFPPPIIRSTGNYRGRVFRCACNALRAAAGSWQRRIDGEIYEQFEGAGIRGIPVDLLALA